MNVDYSEQKVVAQVGGKKLIAVYSGNHYFHRNMVNDTIYNEYTGEINHFMMVDNDLGMGIDKTYPADTPKSVLVHNWEGWCEDLEAPAFRMPNRTFKRKSTERVY